jgi:hypothetical protein
MAVRGIDGSEVRIDDMQGLSTSYCLLGSLHVEVEVKTGGREGVKKLLEGREIIASPSDC